MVKRRNVALYWDLFCVLCALLKQSEVRDCLALLKGVFLVVFLCLPVADSFISGLFSFLFFFIAFI